jgi:hypothetical protein
MNTDEAKEKPATQTIKPVGIPSGESFGSSTVMKSYPYWQYFLAIEADLEITTRYVEPNRDNFHSYSIEFARILLSAGSEIDVVAQVLCRKLDDRSEADNIRLYREQITAVYPRFPTMRVVVPRYGFLLEPWRGWERGETSSWWKSHNKVKHEHDAHFRDANLENALLAVAGLFCLVIYFYQPALYANELKPWARLFTLEKEPGYLMLEQNYELPDFT